VKAFDGSTYLCSNFHFIILLCELVYMVHFQICVSEKTTANGLEACVGNGKEDATQMDDVARIHGVCEAAIHVHRHGSRNMTNRDLICLGEQ